MIPETISSSDIGKAVAWIESNSVPKSRESVYYDLVFDGKFYPPKYVISIAHKFKAGTEYPSDSFNAVEAKNYFIKREYRIRDRRNGSLFQHSPEQSETEEGRAKYSMHRRLERDGKIVRQAKEKRWDETGKLECEVCYFDFVKIYGELGIGFIEAHHTTPVSVLSGRRKTKVEELAMVCSNCHRMIHRGDPILTVDQLKSKMKEQEGPETGSPKTSADPELKQ